ncbi:3-hydroxyisobutyrate dehydrogenase [Enterovirga rhinocerotis]|uniref:3-hydroxyisobutyrate dehydrogenase n=1 Tax=Enterovirga rhinocerotis TaxID=1339210 RepID=A0A4R7BVU4_9HYPH|nr:3-hydroxyisobutyrate dehydrogenase [Enterovirga rhinocerotis]TDR89974.1 3-hydroxyisobutyrate dehydrogenase [Enterovirga rhinocerotis]
MTTIAFIGLGNMGGPMAANLVKAGHRVRGFDLVPASLEQAKADGIEIAASALDAVEGAEAIVTMLPAGKHVRAVWAEIVPAAKAGALIVDCSTIDVESARAVHEIAAARGLKSLDAPVSGGTVGAKGATLTLMVGGTEEAFAAGEPILAKMGRRVVHCGGAGAGQAAKICNNMILGISMIGISEAFVLGEKLGLSHQALFDVASTSSGSCWSLVTHCPVPGPVPTSAANHGYKPGFATELMLKDLLLSQEAAKSAGAATPLGAKAAALYTRFREEGHGAEDYSAIVTYLREQTPEA